MRKTVLMIAAALLLAGCQSDEAEPVATETNEAETTAVSDRVTRQRSAPADTPPDRARSQVDPERELPRLQGQFSDPGMGLANLVDGSSPQAFAESLEMIASETSTEQYAELDAALRYLRMYSSAAWSGLPGLYQSLDNMTGEEIIEHARRLQAERRRR
ncbi:MAG: hypothetical protein EA419_10955 [Wenzhouxiangella sp.]|nr:MAG: hypothetical protein EA419_10955 [Wenzhouxiangella sp.]